MKSRYSIWYFFDYLERISSFFISERNSLKCPSWKLVVFFFAQISFEFSILSLLNFRIYVLLAVAIKADKIWIFVEKFLITTVGLSWGVFRWEVGYSCFFFIGRKEGASYKSITTLVLTNWNCCITKWSNVKLLASIVMATK